MLLHIPGANEIRMLSSDFLLDVAAKTGIILEPEYDGKTARVLIQELNCNRDRFKGNRILFLHTGKTSIRFSFTQLCRIGSQSADFCSYV